MICATGPTPHKLTIWVKNRFVRMRGSGAGIGRAVNRGREILLGQRGDPHFHNSAEVNCALWAPRIW